MQTTAQNNCDNMNIDPDGKQLPEPITLEEDEYILDESAWD